jgi:hypothetical protein
VAVRRKILFEFRDERPAGKGTALDNLPNSGQNLVLNGVVMGV